jgi:hypothetical protein
MQSNQAGPGPIFFVDFFFGLRAGTGNEYLRHCFVGTACGTWPGGLPRGAASVAELAYRAFFRVRLVHAKQQASK